MPRINALKCSSTGKPFLSDETMLAWQCPSTGKLFDSKNDYRKHLKKVARLRFQKRAAGKIARLHRCSTVAEIEQWITKYAQVLADFEADKYGKVAPRIKFSNVKLDLSARMSEQTNRRLGNRPYAGWSGDLTLKDHSDAWRYGVFDLFQNTNIHVGSGRGAGNVDISVILFANEWPNLALMERLAS